MSVCIRLCVNSGRDMVSKNTQCLGGGLRASHSAVTVLQLCHSGQGESDRGRGGVTQSESDQRAHASLPLFYQSEEEKRSRSKFFF